jgi:UDP-glucose 4-epimerase
LSEEPAAIGKVFNIGSDEEVTINRLAERVRHVVGSESPIIRVPYNEAYEPGFEDMFRRVPDLRRIRGLIGYAPTKTLDEMLEAIVASLRPALQPSLRPSVLTAAPSNA